MDPSDILTKTDPAVDDKDESSDEEEEVKKDGATVEIGGKRKRDKASTSWVTMKTVFRWKQTGSVNVEHLLGCGDASTPAELARAHEILDSSGQLICVLCNIPISANKKCVKRHQTKNRKHLNFLLDLANGNKVLNLANTMAATANVHILGSATKSPTSGMAGASAGTPNTATKGLSDPFQAALAQEAWEILKNPEKIIQGKALDAILADLGVYEGKDLVYCEEKEIRDIAATLKKVPQRRFNEIFGIQTE